MIGDYYHLQGRRRTNAITSRARIESSLIEVNFTSDTQPANENTPSNPWRRVDSSSQGTSSSTTSSSNYKVAQLSQANKRQFQSKVKIIDCKKQQLRSLEIDSKRTPPSSSRGYSVNQTLNPLPPPSSSCSSDSNKLEDRSMSNKRNERSYIDKLRNKLRDSSDEAAADHTLNSNLDTLVVFRKSQYISQQQSTSSSLHHLLEKPCPIPSISRRQHMDIYLQNLSEVTETLFHLPSISNSIPEKSKAAAESIGKRRRVLSQIPPSSKSSRHPTEGPHKSSTNQTTTASLSGGTNTLQQEDYSLSSREIRSQQTTAVTTTAFKLARDEETKERTKGGNHLKQSDMLLLASRPSKTLEVNVASRHDLSMRIKAVQRKMSVQITDRSALSSLMDSTILSTKMTVVDVDGNIEKGGDQRAQKTSAAISRVSSTRTVPPLSQRSTAADGIQKLSNILCKHRLLSNIDINSDRDRREGSNISQESQLHQLHRGDEQKSFIKTVSSLGSSPSKSLSSRGGRSVSVSTSTTTATATSHAARHSVNALLKTLPPSEISLRQVNYQNNSRKVKDHFARLLKTSSTDLLLTQNKIVQLPITSEASSIEAYNIRKKRILNSNQDTIIKGKAAESEKNATQSDEIPIIITRRGEQFIVNQEQQTQEEYHKHIRDLTTPRQAESIINKEFAKINSLVQKNNQDLLNYLAVIHEMATSTEDTNFKQKVQHKQKESIQQRNRS